MQFWDNRTALPMLSRRRALLITLGLSAQQRAQQANQTINGTYRVTGMVKHPGEYKPGKGITVLDALGRVGGFLDFANPEKIAIVRDGQRLKFNYSAVIRGTAAEQNILLKNGDVIEVPQCRVPNRELTMNSAQAKQNFTPPALL